MSLSRSSTRYTGETVQHLIVSSTPDGATSFRHTEPMCSVFEVPGENLLELIKHRNKGVGLDYMHRCRGVIHPKIKPQ
ncbi:hypothetical protein DFH09DRAFT_1325119 [Mycena vulgaris]|nr:hypothetical protein DFH09DRAFT_1325119 [Mycena vulgaris]